VNDLNGNFLDASDLTLIALGLLVLIEKISPIFLLLIYWTEII